MKTISMNLLYFPQNLTMNSMEEKGVFQKESASFVIGVSNLDWSYRVVNCDTGITVGCIVSYPTEASYHWAGKFSKKVNLCAMSTLGCKRAGSEKLHGSEQSLGEENNSEQGHQPWIFPQFFKVCSPEISIKTLFHHILRSSQIKVQKCVWVHLRHLWKLL